MDQRRGRSELGSPTAEQCASRALSPFKIREQHRIHFACGRASNFRALVRVSSASYQPER